ncbi:hypothetical protein [Xenorhabdus bharatensis]|uniref:hypothetical protein n=1 Tax=Xenorhabdus bharatensis TaxID=3136256 RepID=UPI0030F44FD9
MLLFGGILLSYIGIALGILVILWSLINACRKGFPRSKSDFIASLKTLCKKLLLCLLVSIIGFFIAYYDIATSESPFKR